jgi:hypothetical protein
MARRMSPQTLEDYDLTGENAKPPQERKGIKQAIIATSLLVGALVAVCANSKEGPYPPEGGIEFLDTETNQRLECLRHYFAHVADCATNPNKFVKENCCPQELNGLARNRNPLDSIKDLKKELFAALGIFEDAETWEAGRLSGENKMVIKTVSAGNMFSRQKTVGASREGHINPQGRRTSGPQRR